MDLTLEALESPPVLETPLDLAHLDHVVRTDCNTFALHLATSVSSLQQKVANLDVVRDAHAVDLKLAALRESIVLAEERHKALRETIFAIPDSFDSIDRLARAAGEAGPVFDSQRSEISRSFSPIRQLLHKMDVMCNESRSSRHLCSSRSEALDDMETKFHAWSDNTKALLSDIRYREERLRAAQREQIRRERLEVEAAEKLRKEQAETEARLKAEQERAKEEREREEAERLHREQVEAQEQMREERERAEARTPDPSAADVRIPPPAAPPLKSAEPPPPVTFDDAWPQSERSRTAEASSQRRSGRAPSTFTEPGPGATGADRYSPVARNEEHPPVTVLKSGVVDGMAYSLYSDGSIEAQMPEGMMRFASIDELRAHLDQRP